MDPRDVLNLNRRRIEGLQGDLDRVHRPDTPGADALIVRTVGGTGYPTAARDFYPCVVVSVDSDLVAGTSPYLDHDPDSNPVYVLNIGSAIPAPGSYHLAVPVAGGHRVMEAN